MTLCHFIANAIAIAIANKYIYKSCSPQSSKRSVLRRAKNSGLQSREALNQSVLLIRFFNRTGIRPFQLNC